MEEREKARCLTSELARLGFVTVTFGNCAVPAGLSSSLNTKEKQGR